MSSPVEYGGKLYGTTSASSNNDSGSLYVFGSTSINIEDISLGSESLPINNVYTNQFVLTDVVTGAKGTVVLSGGTLVVI